MSEKFFILRTKCGREHLTFAEAFDEALRLAQKEKDTFYILKMAAIVEVEVVQKPKAFLNHRALTNAEIEEGENKMKGQGYEPK
jgi:hypothetical protein